MIVEAAEGVPVDEAKAAAHLARAITFKTISHQDPARSDTIQSVVDHVNHVVNDPRVKVQVLTGTAAKEPSPVSDAASAPPA